MTSPHEYHDQVENIGINGQELSAKNIPEARKALTLCYKYKKELVQIKKSINNEIKLIKESYKEPIANAGSKTSVLFSLFVKKNVESSMRNEAKNDLRKERELVIATYLPVKNYIDDFINQIEAGKSQLNDFIIELEEERKDNGDYCSSCGAKAPKTHQFCSKCGQKL